MASIILGGWAGANWFPLLLPVLALLIIFVSFEYLFKFFERKLHHENHANADINNGFDSIEGQKSAKE